MKRLILWIELENTRKSSRIRWNLLHDKHENQGLENWSQLNSILRIFSKSLSGVEMKLFQWVYSRIAQYWAWKHDVTWIAFSQATVKLSNSSESFKRSDMWRGCLNSCHSPHCHAAAIAVEVVSLDIARPRYSRMEPCPRESQRSINEPGNANQMN